MKRLLKIIYANYYVFGGFKHGKDRTFFILPGLRISFIPYEKDSISLIIGVGILFWEFVFNIEISKQYGNLH